MASENSQISELFSNISPRYDFLNHLFSMCMDRYWLLKAIKLVNPAPNARIVDLCCGTGDFSFAFAKKNGSDGLVCGCDFSQNMLDLARRKTAKYASQC